MIDRFEKIKINNIPVCVLQTHINYNNYINYHNR